MEAQVTANHYNFNRYIRDTVRWDAYYYQLKFIIESHARDVLLIGPGDRIVPNLLRMYGVNLTTFDIAADLEPDIVGDLCELDMFVADNTFDCIVCCEVLEHIPFEKTEGIINSFSKKLKTNGKLVLSVPRGGYSVVRLLISVPLLGTHKWLFMPNSRKQRKFSFNGEHYWELGYKGYSIKRIRRIIREYFRIEFEGSFFECPKFWFINARKL